MRKSYSHEPSHHGWIDIGPFEFALLKFFFQGVAFYLPTLLCYCFIVIRVNIFKIFYEQLLKSILNGWKSQKPNGLVNELMSERQWKDYRLQVLEWTDYYHVVVVGKLRTNFQSEFNCAHPISQ